MTTMHPGLLAQSDSPTAGILFWSLALLILVVGMFIAVAVLRKKMSPDEDFHGAGFTLSDLRQMHKAGKMSDEEFNKAKDAMLKSLKNMPAKTTGDVQPKN